MGGGFGAAAPGSGVSVPSTIPTSIAVRRMLAKSKERMERSIRALRS
jgi:hypothetical protein